MLIVEMVTGFLRNKKTSPLIPLLSKERERG